MRKITGIIIAVLLIFGIASAEVELTFNSVPWLSDEETVYQTLSEAGFLRDGKGINAPRGEYTYLIVDDTEFVSPDRIMGADEVTYTVDLAGDIKGKIAGYPVKDLILTFAYDGEYKLIAVKVELIKATYNDLKAKLSKVYGEGEHKETEEGIWSTVWKGVNNSAIILYTQSEGFDFTLMYGRLDAADILSQCLAAPSPDDVSGL